MVTPPRFFRLGRLRLFGSAGIASGIVESARAR